MVSRKPVLTRRRFIQGIAAIGGAGAAYSAMHVMGLFGTGQALAAGHTTAPLPNGSLSGKRVFVIGAGVAGLCSALRAARAGAEVIILEATGRAGGRSLTLRDGNSYQEVDWDTPTTMRFEQVGDVLPNDPDNYLNAGPGRIPQHHTRVLDYCRELGVELQPYIFYDAANLAQNDAWNGGNPVQLRRLKNDLRGALAEMLAKVQNQGALDQLIDPSEVDAFLGMLQQFGQLSAEGAELVYKGAGLKDDYIRAGYAIDGRTHRQLNPGDVIEPGQPWPTLSLDEVLNSDFWNSEMFNNLEYFWQATLMEPVDGMDRIVDGFMDADVPVSETAPNGKVSDMVRYGQPVSRLEVDNGMVFAINANGENGDPADYVVTTCAPGILARIGGNFISDSTRRILSSVYVTPACKVGLQGRYRFWEEEDKIFGGISWTKDITTQIWYPSYSFNSPTGVMTAAYNRKEQAQIFQDYTRDQRLEAALAAGEKLHPGFRDKVFAENGVTIAWAKMPYQEGGWANDTAYTQPDVFEGVVASDASNGKVFFAGDWFSYWPGWQVGSLDSAHYATDRIARLALGRG
jgi:monoamine oxidase